MASKLNGFFDLATCRSLYHTASLRHTFELALAIATLEGCRLPDLQRAQFADDQFVGLVAVTYDRPTHFDRAETVDEDPEIISIEDLDDTDIFDAITVEYDLKTKRQLRNAMEL